MAESSLEGESATAMNCPPFKPKSEESEAAEMPNPREEGRYTCNTALFEIDYDLKT